MSEDQALRNFFLTLIAKEETHPKKLYPTVIWKIIETRFFTLHHNRYEGYFVWVQYADGLFEIWLIVDIRSGFSDNDWHLEKIT